MERVKIQQEEQRGIERMELLISFFYNVVLSWITGHNHWTIWLMWVIWGSWIISFGVFTAKVRDYNFRAMIAAAMSQLTLMLWSMQTPTLLMVLPLFMSAVVVLGLYGIPEIIWLTIGSTTISIFYHGVIVDTMSSTDEFMLLEYALAILAAYIVEFVMYFLVRKRLEGVEKQMRIIANLKAAERSKDDFMANVSHEIRTPINTITGMSEIALRADLPPEVREDIFSIQTAGRNLLSVVSDVLDFSELQAGKLTLAEETYNITSTINDIINMSMARKSEKRIELIVDCDATIPRSLLGDEQKLRRVIMNLVNNAIKFTEEGCVSIIIGYRRTDYGMNLIVQVRDTGIGMKEESLEKLFTTFNQVDTTRSRQEGGIGLGLAISRAIVDAMGGFITVKSEYGRGTEVQFVIPQKIVDESPIVVLNDPDALSVLVYINMEQFKRPEIRDAYSDSLFHMIRQLGVASHVCQNLAEMKRRLKLAQYTHLCISLAEYQEDTAFFDELSKKMNIIIIVDRGDDAVISNQRMERIYKPFFVLPVAMLLNGEHIRQGADEDRYYRGRFVAPDAHILVVDDNLMNIRVVEGLLKPYKIKVSMALSGPEALEKIELMDYDFVFMDHMMPEMDGLETMHRIRQKQGNYFKQVPIIALTANAIGGMREVFLAEGFQDFVAKPIELSVLERVLRRHLPQNKLIPVAEGDKEQDEEQADYPIEQFLTLDPDRFDIAKGLEYCGGKDNYIEILQLHFRDGEENGKKIQTYFEEGNWRDYTILVHALKSSMMSVGAVELSEMAKRLEHAGKTDDVDYIRNNHAAMMKEYREVLDILAKDETINPPKKEEDIAGLQELSEEEYDELAARLEDAVYTFDPDAMLAVIEKMRTCSFCGHGLQEPLEPVVRKIEMSDYMSALETVVKLKEKLRQHTGGQKAHDKKIISNAL